MQPLDGGPRQQQLIDARLAQTSELDERAVRLRYRRNPIENIQRVVFEYTTLCNLDCSHCRNGHVAPRTESRPEALMEAADVMVPLGVERFDFIGGEVTLYGNRWLDVVRHIARHEDAIASVITSGWFLGETKFRAAGAWYDDAEQYLRALKDAGLTHVIFSLDGEAEDHDRIREVPGLFNRVMDGFALVRDAGLEARVSLLVREDQPANWIADVSDRVYGDSPGMSVEDKIARLCRDRTNYVSNC